MNIIPMIAGFSGGVVAGGAFAAVMALIKVIPRLVSLTESHEQLHLYESLFIGGAFIFTIAYFLNIYIVTNIILVGILGLIFGTYLGIFNAALAETLNVLPIISKKLKLKKNLKIIFYSLVIGKVLGSIYYFLYY